MEKAAECKIINIMNQCDLCNGAFIVHSDTNSYKDDNGDYHCIFTHTCPRCGAVFEFEDLKYPYQKFITIENYRDLHDNER